MKERDNMNIKKAFSNSLLVLLDKKPLSKITIGDLLEDTELSRQTFYNHFLDKNDLIAYVYDTVIVNQYFNRVNQPPIPVFVWKS